MADQSFTDRARAALSRLNPVNRFQDFRAHPIQGGISAGAGLIASLFGGPLAGQAVNQGLSTLFRSRNTNEFNAAAQQMQDETRNRLNEQIWGPSQPAQPQVPGQTPEVAPAQDQAQPSNHEITRFGPTQQIDNGWRTGAGGSGLGGGWQTLSGNALQSLLSTAGQSGTGSLAGNGDAVRFQMQPEFGVELTGPNGQQRTRGGDSRMMQHGPLTSSATAQDFIRNNPQQWAQMQQMMRTRN